MKQEITITPDLYASTGKRFLNYFIDLIIFRVMFIVVIILVGLCYALIGGDYDTLIYNLENVNPFLDYLVTYLLFGLYYFFLDTTLKGRSIGKYITKTQAVNSLGQHPSNIDIFKRSFARLIPFDSFSYLATTPRGWHDSLSDTYVIELQKLEDKKTVVDGIAELGKVQDT